MQLGIFAKTFARASFEEIFEAVKLHGLDCVQFNFSCAGLPTVPNSVPSGLSRQVRAALQRRALTMAAVSGTCNLIHPDPAQRAVSLANLEILIHECPQLGTNVVTLCTGTRDTADMWRGHPENHSPDAWRDLTNSLKFLLPMAERRQVILGIEPEAANVIDTALRARELLDEMRSPSLKIIFDAANLVQSENLDSQEKILSQAIDLLGEDVVLAHAKDLVPGPHPNTVAVGRGALKYETYLGLLRECRFNGPLILHSLQENEVASSVEFLKQLLESGRNNSAGSSDALSQAQPT